MEYQKKNFLYGQKVVVVKTNGEMDGKTGHISGIASVNWFDVFIVTLDQPVTVTSVLMPTFSTFTMPEMCLEPIPG